MSLSMSILQLFVLLNSIYNIIAIMYACRYISMLTLHVVYMYIHMHNIYVMVHHQHCVVHVNTYALNCAYSMDSDLLLNLP